MKKFIILSGAYINAGDFLIVKRTEELLKFIYPNCEISKYNRNQDLTDILNEINAADALIIAGGPAYKPSMYPSTIKLVDDLSKIKTKIVPIGVGWYGKNTSNKFIYKHFFSEKSRILLDKIYNDSKAFSCRDWYSVKMLKINGYNNCILTGCPAWYNIDKVNSTNLEMSKEIKKICVSDPADKTNFNDAIKLVKYLKDKYKEATINFVFHRIDKKNNIYKELIDSLEKMKINTIDITGSAEGFKIYDDCDLHIGFRVHAHIYSLSNRHLSILIEEDGRGAGVNEALGIQGFKSTGYSINRIIGNSLFKKGIRYLSKKAVRKMINSNTYLIKDIDNYLKISKDNKYIQHEIAFSNMKMYYETMIEYIKNAIEGDK